jgi:opacity protein-like surface antigen
MRSKMVFLSILASCLLYSSPSTAGKLDSTFFPNGSLQPIISLFGGIADVHANQSQTFTGDDNASYIYNSKRNNSTSALIGGFLGVEHLLAFHGLYLQAGVEYTNNNNVSLQGLNYVGDEPATYTKYDYRYSVSTEQWLAMVRLLATTHEIFHPYLFLGLGTALNQVNTFSLSTQEVGSINVAPTYDNHAARNFSYSIGLGVDTDINKHLRLGFGYRFSSFGKECLGAGKIAVNNYSSSLPFTLCALNTYANQLVAQISYRI